AFVRQIGKLPVVVRDSPGFLVNRVLFPYLLDAAELFESGLDADKIDNALVTWGMPMGPLRLIDEVGVDIVIDIGNTLEKAYGRRDHVPAVLLSLRSRQMLGRKTGAGFYKYEGKTQTPNEALEEWRRTGAAGDGAIGLPNRLAFLMVNEAARCVEEKVVDSPEDADYGMILGSGFAPFRGGPLRFAEHFSLKKIVEETSAKPEKPADAVIDTSKMAKGQREALELAEAARDPLEDRGSFASNLFIGRYDFDRIYPYPAQSAEDRAAGEDFLRKLESYLRDHVDPDEIDRTGEIPPENFKGLAEIGAFGIKVPKKYGGLGLSQCNYGRGAV